MSNFRCPYYYWEAGHWRCMKIKDNLTLHDYDTYCTSETRCKQCPYYNK
ncbi:MAG: hypothetical protein PUB37_09915 [Firmicutes bacterium]|nr:hypothetical protein [Bacillota bacterium]